MLAETRYGEGLSAPAPGQTAVNALGCQTVNVAGRQERTEGGAQVAAPSCVTA